MSYRVVTKLVGQFEREGVITPFDTVEIWDIPNGVTRTDDELVQMTKDKLFTYGIIRAEGFKPKHLTTISCTVNR